MRFIKKEYFQVSNFKELNLQLNIRDVVSKHVDIKDSKILCPFHNDTNPSMIINDNTNTVYCFTCKTLSDAIGFHAEVTKQSMLEAAKELADEFKLNFFAEIDSTTVKRKEFVDKAANSLTQTHIDYLNNRGIEKSGTKKFKLGGAGGWIVQPIYDDNNKLVFYNKRGLLNKEHFIEKGVDKSKYVGGLNIIKTMQGPVFITEGFFDVIQAWQEGIACVNVFGSSLSEEQARKILKYFDNVVLAFDNDSAGLDGSIKAYRLIKEISPSSDIKFANFKTKDLGEHLYNNDEVDTISYYEWSKKNNRSRKELMHTIKYFMSPIERKLNILEIARDLEVTQADVYEELGCL